MKRKFGSFYTVFNVTNNIDCPVKFPSSIFSTVLNFAQFRDTETFGPETEILIFNYR